MNSLPPHETISAISRILAQEMILRRKLLSHAEVIDPWYLEIDVLNPVMTLIGVPVEGQADPLSRAEYRERFYDLVKSEKYVEPREVVEEAQDFLMVILREERRKDGYGSRA